MVDSFFKLVAIEKWLCCSGDWSSLRDLPAEVAGVCAFESCLSGHRREFSRQQYVGRFTKDASDQVRTDDLLVFMWVFKLLFYRRLKCCSAVACIKSRAAAVNHSRMVM